MDQSELQQVYFCWTLRRVPIFLSKMAAQFTSLGRKLSPYLRLFLWATFPEVELLDQKV